MLGSFSKFSYMNTWMFYIHHNFQRVLAANPWPIFQL